MGNLIDDCKIPPVLGVFTSPGYRLADGSKPMGPKDMMPKDYAGHLQRFREFDIVSDDYARHLLDEVLPFIEKEHGVHVSQNPALRCIAGQSSAGLCALVTAWQRPESFGRVLGVSPTFGWSSTGLLMPAVVAATDPPKPIRVYLTAAEHDATTSLGATKMYTELMAWGLERRGYEHQLRIGPGAGHTLRFIGSLLGEALPWLFNQIQTQSKL